MCTCMHAHACAPPTTSPSGVSGLGHRMQCREVGHRERGMVRRTGMRKMSGAGTNQVMEDCKAEGAEG